MPDITVAELMNTTGWDWNLNILEALFCVEDVDMIKSIPLGNYALEDSRKGSRGEQRTNDRVEFHLEIQSTKQSQDILVESMWSVPEVETVKINFDASILRNREGAGLGAIARDHSGRCIAWRMAFVPNVANPELGEAARLAIEIWRRFQWHNCIIEGDCIQIVHKLNSKETDY
ncbi:UNVERIFIED_CONTAM: hypothetical protein Scaly_2729600 [Sesamum calycinum]|uniref:RNase H type-1 domain-containing protein n=1 Tax=Sesamum calycinum TaxID=2727403 RepID=A0AAW2J1Q6_9LAMI